MPLNSPGAPAQWPAVSKTVGESRVPLQWNAGWPFTSISSNDRRMPIPVELTVSDGACRDDERKGGSADREQSGETPPRRRQKSDWADGSKHGRLLAIGHD